MEQPFITNIIYLIGNDTIDNLEETIIESIKQSPSKFDDMWVIIGNKVDTSDVIDIMMGNAKKIKDNINGRWIIRKMLNENATFNDILSFASKDVKSIYVSFLRNSFKYSSPDIVEQIYNVYIEKMIKYKEAQSGYPPSFISLGKNEHDFIILSVMLKMVVSSPVFSYGVKVGTMIEEIATSYNKAESEKSSDINYSEMIKIDNIFMELPETIRI